MKKLTVVGMGPGEYESMTLRAVKALNTCDVIVGYTVYVDLAKPYFPDKEFLTTPMKREIERCEMAFAEAEKGRSVVMICSGDAGIYGMAGPILELGAPLMHDFAVISLSDLLTPWETIENRLDAAAKTDFSICLYNPSSRKRADYLKRACEIFLRYKSSDTVCGIVKNIGRDGETKKVMTLAELRDYEADMFTTVFIGNSRTEKSVLGGQNWMVTPRGYRI